MRYPWLGALLVCLLPVWAHAELFVCGNETVNYPVPGLTGHVLVDPTRAPTALGGKPCTMISHEATEAALALLTTTPSHRLKVTGTPPIVAVEVLSAGEQTAWDAAAQAAADAKQALRDEATTQDVCSTPTLAAITTLLTNRRATLQAQIDTAQANNQAQIDGIATNSAAVIRGALTQMNNVLFAVASNILDETFVIDQKLARCLVVLRQGGR